MGTLPTFRINKGINAVKIYFQLNISPRAQVSNSSQGRSTARIKWAGVEIHASIILIRLDFVIIVFKFSLQVKTAITIFMQSNYKMRKLLSWELAKMMWKFQKGTVVVLLLYQYYHTMVLLRHLLFFLMLGNLNNTIVYYNHHYYHSWCLKECW